MKNIETRRSIRSYTKEEVSDALLNELLTQAMRTQTMGNLQLYSVVVTRSAEMKQRLAPAHFNQPMVTGAPVVLTFCADFRRTTRWAEERLLGGGDFVAGLFHPSFHFDTPPSKASFEQREEWILVWRKRYEERDESHFFG
jgi:nitroreductase